MSDRTYYFLYRVDMWTIDGEKVIEHLAGIEGSDGDLSGRLRALAKHSHHPAAGCAGD
jgi:hypothetical protein